MNPIPPGVMAVPVEASTIRAYCLSYLGYATMGSDVRAALSLTNVSSASGRRGLPFHGEFLHWSLFKGWANKWKFLMCVLKKLHSPMKERTILMDVGKGAHLVQANLSLPGVMPFGVRVKPW